VVQSISAEATEAETEKSFDLVEIDTKEAETKDFFL